MNIEKITDVVSHGVVWEAVISEIENVRHLPVLLRDINYLPDKDEFLKSAAWCEIQVCEEFNVIRSSLEDNVLKIEFECPFVLMVWDHNDQAILRITACAEGFCNVGDIDSVNWEAMNIIEMKKNEILQYKRRVTDLDFVFTDIECDDISFL